MAGEEVGERTQFETAEESHELLSQRKYPSLLTWIPKRYVVGIMAFFGFCMYRRDIYRDSYLNIVRQSTPKHHLKP